MWHVLLLIYNVPVSQHLKAMWSVFVECSRSRLVLSDTHGNISSPGYPNRYPPNSDCVWRLKAPVGNHFIITIQDIDLEWDNNRECGSYLDYLKIR